MPELVVLTEQLLAPVPGGTGRYTRELAAALAETIPAGWEVTGAISRHADPRVAIIPGIGGPRVLPLPRRVLAMAWANGVPLWPGGDAIHAPTPLAPPGRAQGHGLVVTVHDTVPWTHPETLTPRGVRWHRRMIMQAARRADALVVPTATVATELAQYVHKSAQIHVIGEGVTSALSKPQPAAQTEVSRRLALPAKYALVVGTLEPRKGIATLIAALAQPDVPDIPVLFVGALGWGGVDPLELASQHRLNPRQVRVLGRLTDGDLSVVLHGATAVIVPSLAEGFGLPVIEAMAAGVPVVHSDAPALVEVAGGAGVVFPRGNVPALAVVLRAVLSDPDRLAALHATGLARAKHYSWRKAAQQVWQLHLDIHRSRVQR